MTLEIHLPRLVGSREAARAYVAALGTPVAGSPVVVNCRDMRAASATFADELVRVVLVEGGAAQLIVHGASETFNGQMRAAALTRGVIGRLAVRLLPTPGPPPRHHRYTPGRRGR